MLSDDLRITLGCVFLSVVTIELGGLYLMYLAGGRDRATGFQKAFYRAGHAHAGVLVTLGVVAAIVSQSVAGGGPAAYLSTYGVLFSAILIPAGFFLSAMGAGRTSPSRLVWLVYAGAALMAASLVALGLRLILG